MHVLASLIAPLINTVLYLSIDIIDFVSSLLIAMKVDQERVKHLITDTVALLCKNGLQYSKEMKIQGLLGITLDGNEVFLIQLNETCCNETAEQIDVVKTRNNFQNPLRQQHRVISDANGGNKNVKRKDVAAFSRQKRPASRFGHKFGREMASHRLRKAMPNVRNHGQLNECLIDNDSITIPSFNFGITASHSSQNLVVERNTKQNFVLSDADTIVIKSENIDDESVIVIDDNQLHSNEMNEHEAMLETYLNGSALRNKTSENCAVIGGPNCNLLLNKSEKYVGQGLQYSTDNDKDAVFTSTPTVSWSSPSLIVSTNSSFATSDTQFVLTVSFLAIHICMCQ